MACAERFEEKLGNVLDITQAAAELSELASKLEDYDLLRKLAEEIEDHFKAAGTVETESDLDANVKFGVAAMILFVEAIKKLPKSEELAEIKDALRALKREIKDAEFSA